MEVPALGLLLAAVPALAEVLGAEAMASPRAARAAGASTCAVGALAALLTAPALTPRLLAWDPRCVRLALRRGRTDVDLGCEAGSGPRLRFL